MNTTTSVDIGDGKQKLQPFKLEAQFFAINPVALGFSGIIPIFCISAAQEE